MGKSKKRILHKTNSLLNLTREEALLRVATCFKNIVCDKKEEDEAKRLITLFGLSAEELSEAGVIYEHLKSMENII